MKPARSVPLVSSLWFLGSGALAAQPQLPAEDPRFGASLTVEVVNVDVIATGRDGQPISDLTRADFRLFDNGVEVPITNFSAVRRGRRVSEESLTLSPAGEETLVRENPNAAEPPLHIAVLVDNTQLSAFSRNRVLEALGEQLEERVKAGDRVLVASFDRSLTVRQPFTSSWKELSEALDGLAKSLPLGNDQESRFRRTVEEIGHVQNVYEEYQLGAAAEGGPPACQPDLAQIADTYARTVLDEVSTSIGALEAVVDSMAGLPGRKALLHVSDGLPLRPGAEIFELLVQLCAGQGTTAGITKGGVDGIETATHDADTTAPEGAWVKSLKLDFGKYDARLLLQRVAEKASTQRLAIFALEAAGPRDASAVNVDAQDRRLGFAVVDFARVASLQDSLNLLADETGGRALLNTIDWKPALATIAADFDHYYSLGYRPRQSSGEKLREIEVKVRRPGVTVRFQRRHQARSQEQQIADRTLGTLLLGQEDNPLAIELEIGELTSLDGSLHAVPIRLHIPLSKVTFVPQAGVFVASLRLHLAARDRAGKVAPLRTAEIPLTIPAEQLEVARSRSFLYEVKMLMREGDHQVAIGLTDTLGATTSYVLAAVPVVAVPRTR